MYDFYFGTSQEIEKNKADWLTFIKRMLPRWCNSIPDSEFITIHNILSTECNDENLTIVETGCGASTIVLLNHAIENDGVLYSWDMNSLKASHIRSVCMETLGQHYSDKNLWNHWKFVGYNSCCPFAGLDMLKELNCEVDFCFLDSEHTLKTLSSEINSIAAVLKDGAIVSIDDANYAYNSYNEAYINMVRTKFGLNKLEKFDTDNISLTFSEEVVRQLKSLNYKCDVISNDFATKVSNDIFFEYYDSDRKSMGKLGMEKLKLLKSRFAAWKVKKDIM
jgi:hypothetical protein